MDPGRLPDRERRAGLTGEVLLGALGYAITNLKMWFLWGLPMIAYFFLFDYLTEGRFGLFAMLQGDVPPTGVPDTPGPDPSPSPGPGLERPVPHASGASVFLVLLTNLMGLIVLAPLQMMVQRHVIEAQRPLAPYLLGFANRRVWRYIQVLVVYGVLCTGLAMLFMRLFIVGGEPAGLDGPPPAPDPARVMVGIAGMLFTVFVALRLDLAPALCAVGEPRPFRESWRIMRGNVLKLLLMYMGFSFTMMLALSLYQITLGGLTGGDASVLGLLFAKLLNFFSMVATAAITGKFLLYVRSNDRPARREERIGNREERDPEGED